MTQVFGKKGVPSGEKNLQGLRERKSNYGHGEEYFHESKRGRGTKHVWDRIKPDLLNREKKGDR